MMTVVWETFRANKTRSLIYICKLVQIPILERKMICPQWSEHVNYWTVAKWSVVKSVCVVGKCVLGEYANQMQLQRLYTSHYVKFALTSKKNIPKWLAHFENGRRFEYSNCLIYGWNVKFETITRKILIKLNNSASKIVKLDMARARRTWWCWKWWGLWVSRPGVGHNSLCPRVPYNGPLFRVDL